MIEIIAVVCLTAMQDVCERVTFKGEGRADLPMSCYHQGIEATTQYLADNSATFAPGAWNIAHIHCTHIETPARAYVKKLVD